VINFKKALGIGALILSLAGCSASKIAISERNILRMSAEEYCKTNGKRIFDYILEPIDVGVNLTNNSREYCCVPIGTEVVVEYKLHGKDNTWGYGIALIPKQNNYKE